MLKSRTQLTGNAGIVDLHVLGIDLATGEERIADIHRTDTFAHAVIMEVHQLDAVMIVTAIGAGLVVWWRSIKCLQDLDKLTIWTC